MENYEDIYRLCYVRGPEGIIVELVSVVGAGPLALARAQRAQSARMLLETTSVPIIEVAFGPAAKC